eukprot:Pompholyxophrys_sp_v1_NODE_3_length_18401_cov_4.332280.p15 type:complete len:108 gc:universal NODE_3_length_18401_cov_4.332280:7874-7551(-)
MNSIIFKMIELDQPIDRDLIQGIINENATKFAGFIGGFTGAMIGLSIGSSIFAKVLVNNNNNNIIEDDMEETKWTDIARATLVFGGFTIGCTVAGAIIGRRLVENLQ